MQYNNNNNNNKSNNKKSSNTKVLWAMLVFACLTSLLATAAVGVGASEAADMQKMHTPTHRQRMHHNRQHPHQHHHPHQHQHHNHEHQQHHNQQQQQRERDREQRRQRRLETLQQLKADVELLPGVTLPPPPAVARKNATTSTRLRRVYNRLHSRNLNGQRSNNEWDYNFYTNTFGAPPASKGDDNLHDVEFIGGGGSGTARGYDYVPTQPQPQPQPAQPPSNTFHRRAVVPTLGPVPPLVPARRGYATTAPRRSDNDLPTALMPTTPTTTTTTTTTDNPYETNTINRNYPSDPKDMERRHICVQQRTITMPFKTTEVYTRPTWKHISTPCQPPTHANQMCTRVQLVHEQAYRDVIRHKSAQQVTYDCCTGWTRETPHADACMKPICAAQCQNGGTCDGPDKCSCPAGFNGRYCEHDVNECKEEKPCDQTCINTVGSYYCRCREGFVLQADQQSCKKMDLHADDAFEARDLENDIDTDDEMSSRLQKIERSLANERVHTHELQKSLQATHNVVDTLKSRLSTLEKQQLDYNRLQTNLFHTESRTNKLEGMLNLLMKCRNGPNANCP